MPTPIISGPYKTFRRLNPYESFVEYEGSTITIPMKGRRSAAEPWMEDEIKLKAFMRLELYPPYLNNLGTREFQFTIRDWELYGQSPMLNELFHDDPRGRWTVLDAATGAGDYVPVSVSFTVANHYQVGVDPGFNVSAHDVFGDVRNLELRDLTSHHLRIWSELPERDARWTYGLPQNRLYWQVIPSATIKANARAFASFSAGSPGPLIVFHKKPPRLGLSPARFDASDPMDIAKYLVAVSDLTGSSSSELPQWVGTLSKRGLLANQVQLPGNSFLSSIRRQRSTLEVRWTPPQSARDLAAFDAHLLDASGPQRAVTGWIQIGSPARSLCTADQGPDLGRPVDSADFPARITYAINYHIFLNKERFVEDQAGVATAVGVTEIPPRDVTVAFDKPHLGHVLQRFLEFSAGHCTGMHEISEAEFRAGVNYCRYWRTTPLDPHDPEWSQYRDYDPSHAY